MRPFFRLLLILCFPVYTMAQFSSKKDVPATIKDTIANTVDLKLKLNSDTTPAKIIVFAKGQTDQFLSWIDGYLVVKTYKFPNGEVAGNVGSLAYTQKWELIKPEDIYDVKLISQVQPRKTN